jgi:murein DD-endopeptidase MepM/ murein hydrolase activator NlpD
LKRALKKREKAVLKNTPNNDGVPVEPSNDVTHKINRRSGTQAAMIGLAISMGATSLLVTRQSDQAQAAVPIGSQKAASTIPAVSETEIKFAATKLESQAISSARAPENPVIVEPTAVSQVPGLEAKWPVAAKEMAVTIPTTEANRNAIYLQPVGEASDSETALSQSQAHNQAIETAALLSQKQNGVTALTTTSVTLTAANSVSQDVDKQLKAQQDYAITRLQEKSNRLRNSLAELRSQETENSSSTNSVEIKKPTTVANKDLAQQSEEVTAGDQASLISRLKQDKQDSQPAKLALPAPVKPKVVVAQSTAKTYEVKPGDTLAEIASNYGTSISELVKVNNLDDPNQLKINQKLIIPTENVGYNSEKQPQVVATPVFRQPSRINTITSSAINSTPSSTRSSVISSTPSSVLIKPDLEANLPEVPESPIVSDNRNVAIPIPVAKETQRLVNTPTRNNSVTSVNIPVPVAQNNQLQAPEPEIDPTPAKSSTPGWDTQQVNVVAETQQPEQKPQQIARVKGNERIRSLQAEIERLREKYRTQQSGVTVSTVTEEQNASAPLVVEKTNNAENSEVTTQLNAVTISVPQLPLPSNKTQPTKSVIAARANNEPVNPQLLSQQTALPGNTSSSSSGIRLRVPPAGTSSNDSLGKLRGTTVSPALPPLAAVDMYLPKAIDQTTDSSTTSKAYIWPAKGVLTSGYGWRWGRMHRGIDIANSTGTPIYASAPGTVERAGWNNGGYGNLVDIRHPDGSLTRYAHNSRILVRVGQQVEQGQTIAAMGSTGFSTGPHSHFEIHPAGRGAINPIALLPQQRI